MKKSLRYKLTLILLAFVLVIIIANILISNLFLKDYYLNQKQSSLIATYEEIDKLYADQAYTGKEASEVVGTSLSYSLNSISENGNVSIQMYRLTDYIESVGGYAYETLFSTQSNRNESADNTSEDDLFDNATGFGDRVTNALIRNLDLVKDFNDSYKSAETLRKTDTYVIQKNYIKRLDGYYIYLSASLSGSENDDYILLRTSVNSIEESVNISNRFFMYVSFAIMLLGMAVLYIITRRFTSPILRLADISRKMAELNFDTRYEGQTNDEIGILGNSINYLSETLESTLGELKTANSELQRDLEKKTQIDEMRREFLSNVSHELKTPLALIQGYAEGLKENIEDSDEDRDFYCEVIMDEANKMNTLVKKLLNLNQLEFGNSQVTMEHFDIVDVVKNLLFNSNILFKQKEVNLKFNSEDEIYVWADIFMVEEVFSNYLSNALHHVSGENMIEVNIESDGERARISVFNTGELIPEEEMDKLWVKFYKVDKARTREYGGSGVGLSIVKASMDLLGQAYGVRNKENGVEFWFELDCKNIR